MHRKLNSECYLKYFFYVESHAESCQWQTLLSMIHLILVNMELWWYSRIDMSATARAIPILLWRKWGLIVLCSTSFRLVPPPGGMFDKQPRFICILREFNSFRNLSLTILFPLWIPTVPCNHWYPTLSSLDKNNPLKILLPNSTCRSPAQPGGQICTCVSYM